MEVSSNKPSSCFRVATMSFPPKSWELTYHLGRFSSWIHHFCWPIRSYRFNFCGWKLEFNFVHSGTLFREWKPKQERVPWKGKPGKSTDSISVKQDRGFVSCHGFHKCLESSLFWHLSVFNLFSWSENLKHVLKNQHLSGQNQPESFLFSYSYYLSLNIMKRRSFSFCSPTGMDICKGRCDTWSYKRTQVITQLPG